MRLILASTSPRRRKILALLRLPFDTVTPQFNEIPSKDRPIVEEVLEFAVAKAQSVAGNHPGNMIIGSDTMILLNSTKIGKPEGLDDAARMLRVLSGQTHQIFTSVAILDEAGGPGLRIVEQVSVKMRNYSVREIENYLACDESLDKAGAYSIQGEGRGLIESVRGDYLAAVGLPLKPIANYLKGRNISISVDVDKLYTDKSFLNWRSFS
ncbi:MAG TPA: Maf family protein [Candidatus Binatia bacterium]|jgi:septum formation protein